MELLKKKKRKELFSQQGIDDTDDEQLMAERWVEALKPPLIDSDIQSSSNNTGRSVAIWFPKHRVSVVVSLKGKMMMSLGVTGDGETCLLPEETLYLAEKRYLTLYHGGNQTVLNSYADAKDFMKTKKCEHTADDVSDDGENENLKLLKCLSTNTQDLYSNLTDNAGVTLECYLTYRTLRDRLNYIVRRESRHLGGEIGTQTGSSTYPYRIHILKPIPDIPHYKPGMKFDESIVAFETFPWTSSFSKNRCGTPETRVIVVHAEDHLPDMMALHALISQKTSTIPINNPLSSTTTSTPTSTITSTTSSTITSDATSATSPITLKVSMVDQEGSVSFMSFGTSPIKAIVKVKRKKKNKKSNLTSKEELN